MNHHGGRRTGWLWFACAVMLASCNGADTVAAEGRPATAQVPVEGHVLDLQNPTTEERLGPEVAAPEARKFVQIAVTRVSNPRRVGMFFTVQFTPPEGDEIQLGSFSLFPPDNPGRFIVATRGALRTGGTVSVTLVPLQPVGDGAEIRVWMAPFTYLSE